MRRTSVSLPTSKAPAHDPHEKSNRYSSSKSAKNSAAGTLEKVQNAWMTQSARSRYLKTGGILFFVIFLFYILAPSGESRYSGGGSSGIIKPSGGQTPSDSSYGTSKCTKSSDKSKPIIQYVLMIDAGSTGSRIHVYRFNNCGSTPELESEDFMMNDIKVGGLSRYDDDPEAAAKTLDPLLEMAMKKVPDALKGCSPVAVKATAGLRKSGQAKSEKILQAVRTRLETAYPFPVVSAAEGGVEVMEGKDEGVYAWITTNYLLGKIGGPDHSPTAAVFDLGGGSTQVVFEPTFQASKNGGMPEHMAEGDHKYKLSFGGREFELYQHSHLGFGLMEARNTMHKTLIDDILSQHQDDATNAWLKKPIVNPCIAPGMTKAVNVTMGADHKLGNKILVDMAGPSSPAPALCRGLAEKILVKDKECKLAPCSFNGIHQPSLEKTFAREDIYTFSYFYDRTQPLGMPESFTLRELQHLTEQVCGGEKAWDVFTNVPDAIEKELKGRPEQCLDLNFMMALLHTGYEMPIDREVKIAKKIKGNELGWCLGASLPLLSQGSGWKCKVKQIQ